MALRRSPRKASTSGAGRGLILMLSFVICARVSSAGCRSLQMRLPRIIRPSETLSRERWTIRQPDQSIRVRIENGRGRYSPPIMVESETEVLLGNPDEAHISTSFVERQNLSVRMECRRFTRLTNAFSKKLASLKASVALHYAHYNFVRVHRTLRCTPAMAAGVTDRLWSVEELIERAE